MELQNYVIFNPVCRSWKNRLKSCAPSNQVEIYQTLCILLNELDVATFNVLIDQFTRLWETREPDFIQYFKQFYKNRPGLYHPHC